MSLELWHKVPYDNKYDTECRAHPTAYLLQLKNVRYRSTDKIILRNNAFLDSHVYKDLLQKKIAHWKVHIGYQQWAAFTHEQQSEKFGESRPYAYI